ncbi:MAG: hypothetical protein JSV16_15810 [Candidatus Hydrogenedentota bacterium]|nr:MAG: hypothetical protein JSV16_15810 [Candidatus Hydrogenedentota bacterium]
MQTQCVRCHKTIDTVQGYKFSPTEYLCMSCYDEYKAERVERARKQHKNPLIDQFGDEAGASTVQATGPPGVSRPQPPPRAPDSKIAPEPRRATPPPDQRAQAPPPPKPTPEAELCDVCKRPVSDFKVPLKGGKKACLDCNNILREVAKSLVLNIQCPHCGKEIQVAQS